MKKIFVQNSINSEEKKFVIGFYSRKVIHEFIKKKSVPSWLRWWKDVCPPEQDLCSLIIKKWRWNGTCWLCVALVVAYV